MEMSPGETMLLLVFGAFAVITGARFIIRLFEVNELGCSDGPRIELGATLVSCVAAHCFVAGTVAPANVRSSIGILLLFTAAHTAVLLSATTALGVLGLSAIDDGIERNNRAARMAVIGFWIALTICAVGSELGEGEEVATTLVPLGLSTFLLLTLAAIYSATTRSFSAITLERDTNAGVRLAALFVASSVPLAFAARGNWVSYTATAFDFARELPLLLGLLGLGIAFDRAQRTRPNTGRSWLATTIFFAIAAARWRWGR